MLNWGSRLRCKLLIWEPTIEDGNQNPVESGEGTGGKEGGSRTIPPERPGRDGVLIAASMPFQM
jgi:hypothetical protein